MSLHFEHTHTHINLFIHLTFKTFETLDDWINVKLQSISFQGHMNNIGDEV